MLSFPIAIGPYHQRVASSSLTEQVSLDALAFRWNTCDDWCIEEGEGIARSPYSVSVVELMSHKMARDGGYSEGRIGLRIIKIIVSNESIGSLTSRVLATRKYLSY
jgi:hypothetical protein